MPALSAWYVRKGVTNYLLNNSGQAIIYKPNQYQQAVLDFDITKTSDPVRGALGNEDQVSVWIGDPSAGGVKMLDGFLVDLGDEHRRGGRVIHKVVVVDYIGYLGGKSPFEKRYWFLTDASAKQVFEDSSNAISGAGVPNVDAALTKQVKMEFLGTYAKDGFSAAAQYGGADYFGDESKVLQAFPFGARDLNASNGVRYKLQDTPSLAVNQIKIDSNREYLFLRNSIYKFRKVIATNAISFTYPDDINAWQTQTTDIRGLYGPDFSRHFQMTLADYDRDLTPAPPKPYNIENLLIADDNIPLAVLNVAKNTQNINILVGEMDLNTFTFPRLEIPYDTWQELSFFFRTTLTPTPTDIEITLVDLTAGADYTRFIKQGANTLLLPGGMTFLRFLLPTSTANNGWTKSGAPTKIDQIQISFTPATGYTAGTSVKIGQFYLFKRVRKTSATAAGTPVTTKIIVNRTIVDETLLQNLADTEYSRVNTDAYFVKATAPGNTDFRKPAYNIDVNFAATLQTDKFQNQLRIDEIRHTLEKSRHRMEITLKPSFQRL